MKTRYPATIMVLFVVAWSLGCSTYKDSGGAGQSSDTHRLEANAKAAVVTFKAQDPSMGKFFKSAHGYAVYPTVGKGGLGIGGAYGKGELFEQGEKVGYCDLSQATIGFQLGGQAYSEIIFFQTTSAFSQFKSGNYAFSAQASAIAASAGVSADADYDKGVAVFTMAKGGLMYEASVGGQKFSFVPE